MDQKGTNPYSTEIPVTEAEQQMASQPQPVTAPVSPSQPITPAPTLTPPAPASLRTQHVPPTTPPPAANPPGTPPPHKQNSILPKIIIGFLVVMILGLSGVIVSNKMKTKNVPKPTPTVAALPTPTAIPTATPTPMPDEATTSADPSSLRFYSKDLGILFDTAKNIPASAATINTKVVGSRVYVYGSTTDYSTGQYIDVLSKISTDDVATAAQKVTQGDPHYQNCTFSITPQSVYPETYQMASPTCPPAVGSGISFFLTDSDHPAKLLFVSIGQYTMPATSNPQTKWQDTIRFLTAQPSDVPLQ